MNIHIKFRKNLLNLLAICMIMMIMLSFYKTRPLTSIASVNTNIFTNNDRSYNNIINNNISNNTNSIVVNNTHAATALVPPVGTAPQTDKKSNNNDEIVNNNNKPFIPTINIPVYNNDNTITASTNNNNINNNNEYRYNNNYTTLMSYYPISMYPGNSRNGLYEYPHREGDNNNINNNNNVNENNINSLLYNNLIKESSVEGFSSLPHPTCLAVDLISSFIQEHSNNNNNNSSDGAKSKVSSDKSGDTNNNNNNNNQNVINELNQWFSVPGVQCLKPVYGERYNNNNNNNNNNFDEDEKKYNSPFSHIMLRNIIYFKGEFYYVTPPQKEKYNNNTNNNNNKTKEEDNDYISFSYGGDFIDFDMAKLHLVGNFTLRRLLLNKQHLYSNNTEKGININNINNISNISNPLHLRVPLAYWQPPTDYVIQYHTLAEIVMPALQTIIKIIKGTDINSELFYNNNRINNNTTNNNTINNTTNININNIGKGLLPPVFLITSRMRGKVQKIKTIMVKGTARERCHEVPNTYENPDLISPINNNNNTKSSTINNNNSNMNCMNTPLGRMMQAVVGTAGVYGLQAHHAQTYLGSNILRGHLYRHWQLFVKKGNYDNNNITNKNNTRGDKNKNKDNNDIFFIDRLLVGAPTHCSPLPFGSSAYYAEAVAQDQFLRGKGNTSRINLRKGNNNNINNNSSSPKDILRNKRLIQFFDVYRECQLFLWEYRNFFLNKITSDGGDIYNYYNKKSQKNPITGDINHNQTSTSQNRHQTVPEINHIIKKEKVQTIRRDINQSDALLKDVSSQNNNNNNSSYTSPSALHRGIRMLPIIPPVYSDSVTPININNNTSNNNISSKYGDGIHIVIASRKGDWAREYNEEEIASSIRTHFKKKVQDAIVNKEKGEKSLDNNLNNNNKSQKQAQLNYLSIAKQAIYATATVRIVKFTGNNGLQHKLLHQLAVPKTTIFIGNHGANIIPSIFLRPNSGVITLSFSNPGFYPYTVFPRWLHWRDIVINQKCNPRRVKKACWFSKHPNNNDMVATEGQIVKILEFIDEIIAEQIERPKGLNDINI